MVFSSIPVYLDPPNWQQQHQNQQPGSGGGGSSSENNQLTLPLPPIGGGGGSGSNGPGSIRPGSMADRARLAKLPQPETALKCPRCESTNTKFCYFNNYSLAQPRHFCKTCRRYWTRGGALRNVPVGGGCRRNKRSKGGSRSKSPVTTASERHAGGGSSSSTSAGATDNMLGHLPPHLPPPQLPFHLPHLQHLSTEYGAGAAGGNIGLNFGGLQPPQMSATGGGADMLSSGLGEQWRLPHMQQFPFLAGLEPPAGLYPFEGEGGGYMGGIRAKSMLDSGVSQVEANVKMEENQGLNLSRNFLGVLGQDQYWGGGSGNNNAWTDLSGFTSSSSTSHYL